MFGLVAIFGLIAFILAISLIAKVVQWRVNSNPKHKQIGYRPIFWVVGLFVWTILNGDELIQSIKIDLASKDCGWTEYKNVKNVEGIYFEEIGYSFNQSSFIEHMFDAYPAVERLDYKGNIIGRQGLKSDHRSFRYGIQSQREIIESNIVRTTTFLKDFDTNDILAKRIEYDFESYSFSWGSQMTKLLLFFTKLPLIMFHNRCNNVIIEDEINRIIHVLQPKGAINPDEYSSPFLNAEAQEVNIETLEKEDFTPEKSMTANDIAWDNLNYDAKRVEACKSLLIPEYENSQFLKFVNDPSNLKRIKINEAGMFCDPDVIWMIRIDKTGVMIAKFNLMGDLKYKLIFTKPDEPSGYLGSIFTPTFKSENGYLIFEWWNTNYRGYDVHMNRRMKLRIKEPESSEDGQVGRRGL